MKKLIKYNNQKLNDDIVLNDLLNEMNKNIKINTLITELAIFSFVSIFGILLYILNVVL